MKLQHLLSIFTIILAATIYGQSTSKNDSFTLSEPIHQLRIYEIPKENGEAFHIRFRDHAYRIMKEYGFQIVATWESSYNENVEFVYLLEWPNEEAMTLAWNKFMADHEWKEIKALTSKEHGNFVNEIQDRKLKLTGYSPQFDLVKKQ